MNSGELQRESAALRERLSRLSQASRRINESLDFDKVLQDVVDSARELTGARYGAITAPGEAGQRPDFIVSGLTSLALPWRSTGDCGKCPRAWASSSISAG